MKDILLHLDGRVFGAQSHGGISRVFTELMRAWKDSGDIHVRLCLPPECNPAALQWPADEIVRIPCVRQWRPRGFFAAANAVRQQHALARFWAEPSEGIFCSTYYSTHPSLRIPQLFVLQDMIYERFPKLFPDAEGEQHRAEKAACAEAADIIVCPSEHALSEARHFYDLRNKKTHVIPYAVNPDFFTAPSPEAIQRLKENHTDARDYLLFVGGRARHKNFAALLAAFARWPARHSIMLVAVGGGAIRADEAAMIEGFNLGEDIAFLPHVSDSELVDFYYGARAAVAPALCEGFGLPLLEAMATGCPVASSYGGSLREVGRDVAFYFDPRDAESMSDALNAAVTTRRDAERILRGIHIAKARTWPHVAADFAAAIG